MTRVVFDTAFPDTACVTIGAEHRSIETVDGPSTMNNEPAGDARKIKPLSEIPRFDDGEIIPHGWKIVRLGEVSNIETGSRNNQDKVESGQYPFFVRSDVVERIDTYSHECEAIIIPGEGGIGNIFHYINGRFELHQRVYKVSDFMVNMHGKFVYYAMAQFFGTHAMRHTVKATVDSLRLPTFKKFSFPAPQSRLEQCAIAEALSDVDGLIESLESLITKKQAVKDGTMQQLLTGKTRLPGFRTGWRTKRLGRLGPFLKGCGIKREDVSSTGFPCIRYGELYTRHENYILNTVARVPSSIAKMALPIKTGDLLFAGSGETSEEIGRCAAYLGDEPAYAGGDVVVLRPLEQNSLYLGYLMNRPAVARQKARMSQGDAVVHVSARSLAQVEVDLPPVEEQIAVAAVLFDMDAEIAALERRLDKIRAIKQGAMQQLLTGKIRLVDPA